MSANINTKTNNELKKIFKYTNVTGFNNHILNKSVNVNFRGVNLKNILQSIKNTSKKNENTSTSTQNLTHFLKFNSMYFSNNERRSGYTRKFYEVYSTFIMMMELMDYIKSFIEEYINIENNTNNLSKDIQIRENINMSTVVFDKENIESAVFNQSITPLFGSSPDSIKEIFNRYKYQRGIMTLSDNSISNITLFETLFNRYNNNERLSKIIPSLISQYNVFKSKIFDILCDNENKNFDFGLLGFGFLFAYDFFPNVTEDKEINTFFNKKLYDMSIKNIDIESEIKNMIKTHNSMGLKMASSINYFYNNSYRDSNFYQTLLEALNLDLYGLKFALFYIHPKFLELFLKRKYKIDKQMYNYLASYDVKIEAQGNFKYEDPTSQFINPNSSKIFFSDYDSFISK